MSISSNFGTPGGNSTPWIKHVWCDAIGYIHLSTEPNHAMFDFSSGDQRSPGWDQSEPQEHGYLTTYQLECTSKWRSSNDYFTNSSIYKWDVCPSSVSRYLHEYIIICILYTYIYDHICITMYPYKSVRLVISTVVDQIFQGNIHDGPWRLKFLSQIRDATRSTLKWRPCPTSAFLQEIKWMKKTPTFQFRDFDDFQ